MTQGDHGSRGRADIALTAVTTLFRGNARLLVRALPFAIAIVVLKLVIDELDWNQLELSPLLTVAVSAEVFIVGFMLAGTTGDFRESEKLPAEIGVSLETIADESLIIWKDISLRE